MGQVTMNLPDGSQVVRDEPLIAARTSTKLAVGSGVIAAYPVIEILTWVQGLMLPWPWLESLTNSPGFVYYGGVLVSFVIARFSKSPAVPGKVL